MPHAAQVECQTGVPLFVIVAKTNLLRHDQPRN